MKFLVVYLAQVVSVWTDVLDNTTKPEDCILCMGDNTSAMGWLRRSNFRQEDDSDCTWLIKQEIGRHLATIVLEAGITLYPQWFKGSHNTVADSLSIDAYFLSANTHKQFLLATVPQQLPRNFSIRPLPKEITCYLSSMLHKMPETKQWLKPQKPSELAAGNTGILTSIVSELKKSSLMDSHNLCKIPLSQDLGKQFDKAPSLQEIINNWLKEQSQPPSHMWHRPSGQTTGRTQDWTRTAKPVSKFLNNLEDIEIKTLPRRNRKRFL